MKTFYRFFIIICLPALFISCDTHHKKINNSSEIISTHENVSVNTIDSVPLQKSSIAIGPIHWGITDDAFCKILPRWTQKLKQNGFIVIAGMKTGNNGILPEYDKDGHLTGIKIEFQKFSIHPEPDYTEAETDKIKELYLEHNQKISKLIEEFSKIYGNADENNFDEKSEKIYLYNGSQTLVKWNTDINLVSLNIENKTFDEMVGCEMNMWVKIQKTAM